ncbi:MAG: ECF transporter S component [Lachnospiraceae bacterium]|nr:ECF transporter S component [Lachnospiraceae bacterium]
MRMTGTSAAVQKRGAETTTLVTAGVFLALGIIMPFLVGQIPEIGGMLLPMHIPVLICGYVCGWKYGLLVGFITPLLRSVMFGMPPMMPTAAAMAFELAVYGSVTGILYGKYQNQRMAVYISLIGAMIAGRLVWGLVSIPMYGIVGKSFSVQLFLAGAFLNAVPGIILQLVLIPVVIQALRRAGVIPKHVM